MKPPISVAHSSTRSYVYDSDGRRELRENKTTGPKYLPMLSSHCPGWVCYAEKTQPESLPYLSEVKSAQQIIGSLLRMFQKDPQISSMLKMNTARPYYHVSVQPCFDKKLEASRRDFFDELDDCPEVDLVLSTQELLDLVSSQYSSNAQKISLEEFFLDLPADTSLGGDRLENLFRSYSPEGWELVQGVDRNAGSGGYAEHIFKFAAQEILGLDLWSTELEYKVLIIQLFPQYIILSRRGGTLIWRL